MSSNPFSFGSMTRDPNKFVGRRAELQLIIARLNGNQPQGSSIIGPRRIGKSSLLYHLTNLGKDKPWRLGENLCIVYLSAAAGSCSTPEEFRLTIIQTVLNGYSWPHDAEFNHELIELHENLERKQLCSWAIARDILQKLPFHPVICLDEFEALLLNDAFDDRFFNALRTWANEGLVSWVTASSKPLQELLEDNNLTSPFFNLLATVPLAGLTDTEADELLKLADTTSYSFTNQEKRMVKRLAGPIPYHLQIVAWRLWEIKKAEQVVQEKTLRDFLCQQPYPPTTCAQNLNSIQHKLNGHMRFVDVIIKIVFLLIIIFAFLLFIAIANDFL